MKYLVKNLLYIVAGTAAAYLLLIFVAPLFTPFILAVFLAFFLEPVVKRIQGRGRMSRGPAVGVAMLATFGSATLLIVLSVTRLIIELVHLTAYLPEYINNIKSVALSTQNKLLAYYFTLPEDVIGFITKKVSGSNYSLDAILGKAQVLTQMLLNFFLQLVSSVPAWIILILISAIATYFISKDKRLIIDYWLKAVPEPWGRQTVDITKQVFQAIISYVRAQLVLITITFVNTLIGLYIIGAPYALLMSLVVGVTDLIPILGPSSIYLPWIAWEFTTGDSTFAIKLTILYAVVLIVRQVMETKIVSQSMGLHPLATMVAMYAGLKALGPMGVVAGPLFLITLKAFASAGLIGWKSGD